MSTSGAAVVPPPQAAEAAGVTAAISIVDMGGRALAFRRDDRAVLNVAREAFTVLQLDASTAGLVNTVER